MICRSGGCNLGKDACGRISAELLAHLQTLSADVYQTDDGFVHVTVSAEKDIPTLVNWLVAHNHALYELNLERLSLEDRFPQNHRQPQR